ncbi:MAG TPA: hypothetical protein VGM52_12010 [Herbaspirillum sp.]|jgi:hypothetical protein
MQFLEQANKKTLIAIVIVVIFLGIVNDRMGYVRDICKETTFSEFVKNLWTSEGQVTGQATWSVKRGGAGFSGNL